MGFAGARWVVARDRYCPGCGGCNHPRTAVVGKARGAFCPRCGYLCNDDRCREISLRARCVLRHHWPARLAGAHPHPGILRCMRGARHRSLAAPRANDVRPESFGFSFRSPLCPSIHLHTESQVLHLEPLAHPPFLPAHLQPARWCATRVSRPLLGANGRGDGLAG